MKNVAPWCLCVSAMHICFLLSGCTSQPTSNVKYGSGEDVRDVGRGLATKFLNDRWIDEFRSAEGRPPQVRVGDLKLAADMPTDVNLLIGDFQEELYNSQRGMFLADRENLDQGAGEREDDAGRDPTQSSKKSARKKADFLLTGSFTHQRSGPTDVIYRASIKLQNTDTDEIVPKNYDILYKNGKRVE